MILKLLPEFDGRISVQFSKSNGGTPIVSEEQFLANHKPDIDLILNFPKEELKLAT